MRIPILLLVIVDAASGGEYALLASGARLHADRHEMAGGMVRLYVSGGSIEVDATQIVGFEPEEVVSAAPVTTAGMPLKAARLSEARGLNPDPKICTAVPTVP